MIWPTIAQCVTGARDSLYRPFLIVVGVFLIRQELEYTIINCVSQLSPSFQLNGYPTSGHSSKLKCFAKVGFWSRFSVWIVYMWLSSAPLSFVALSTTV